MMIRKWLSNLLVPKDPPEDTLTSDEEKAAFEAREREFDLRLRWIRYQADQLSRMEREHDELTDNEGTT